jgi:heme/copper-type cytochrome/quinol oxidase subunit 2
MSNLLAQSPSPAGIVFKSPLRSEITDISSLINILIKFLFPIASLMVFGMIVYAGFTFMNSKGNATEVGKAKDMILNSLIGLVLLVVAFFIVRIAALIFGFTGGILSN